MTDDAYVCVLVDDEIDDDCRPFLESVDGVKEEEGIAHESFAENLPRVTVHKVEMNLLKLLELEFKYCLIMSSIV